MAESLGRIAQDVVVCTLCPRLVAWREEAASHRPKRFEGETYWARPVPGFGSAEAHLLIVGLAPAAHGGNRTGRIFTGDRSGDFLFEALHRAGYANRPTSHYRDDGLELTGCYIAAVNRCAPPANRPTPAERDNCLPYLEREIGALDRLEVMVALGSYAWDGVLRALRALGHPTPRPKPRFGHRVQARVGPYTLIGCYHPSQQNTFTGVLTPDMLAGVLELARSIGS